MARRESSTRMAISCLEATMKILKKMGIKLAMTSQTTEKRAKMSLMRMKVKKCKPPQARDKRSEQLIS